MVDEPVVEAAALERLLRIGGQPFLLEMIDLFLAHAPGRLAAARAALGDGDHHRLYGAAHSLKATAGNLGARRLQAVAEEVERRSRAGEAASLPALLDEMDRCYEGVRERLEAERRRRGGAA